MTGQMHLFAAPPQVQSAIVGEVTAANIYAFLSEVGW